MVHVNERDVTMTCVSRAPLVTIDAYKRRMGWRFPWVSSLNSDFNFDFGVSYTAEQQANGAEYNVFNTFYQLLDRAPKGRDEDNIPAGAWWWRRHDEDEDR